MEMSWSWRRGPATAGLMLPWEWLRALSPEAAAALDAMSGDPLIEEIDRARILTAVERAAHDPAVRERLVRELATGPRTAMLHPSGLRTLPGRRFAAQDVLGARVRIGRVVPTWNSAPTATRDLRFDRESLRSSLLVFGPPGAGKTRGLAIPIVEYLSLAALTGRASVVVIDSSGDDFAFDGWFDITIDPRNPTHGFGLFGGAVHPETAAERLTLALLPEEVSPDVAYLRRTSYRALLDCLAPFHLARGRWPTVPELQALLRAQPAAHAQIKAALRGKPDAREQTERLDRRARHSRWRYDPAAKLLERFAELDRPALHRLFDHERPFDMSQINRPIRVRIAVPRAEYPVAAAAVGRLVASQFVRAASSASTNRTILKTLVVDDAGRCVEEDVADATENLRAKNAGLVLLATSLADYPAAVRPTLIGGTGGKAVFGGVDAQTAAHFAQWLSDEWGRRAAAAQGRSNWANWGLPSAGAGDPAAGGSTLLADRPRWTVSDITGVPPQHCVVSVRTGDDGPVGAVLVNLRG